MKTYLRKDEQLYEADLPSTYSMVLIRIAHAHVYKTRTGNSMGAKDAPKGAKTLRFIDVMNEADDGTRIFEFAEFIDDLFYA